MLLQFYARYSSNNLESVVESFLKKLQYILVNGLTIKSELHTRIYKYFNIWAVMPEPEQGGGGGVKGATGQPNIWQITLSISTRGSTGVGQISRTYYNWPPKFFHLLASLYKYKYPGPKERSKR